MHYQVAQHVQQNCSAEDHGKSCQVSDKRRRKKEEEEEEEQEEQEEEDDEEEEGEGEGEGEEEVEVELEVEDEQKEPQEPTVPPPTTVSMECQTGASFLSEPKPGSSLQQEGPVPPEGSAQTEVSGEQQADIQEDDTAPEPQPAKRLYYGTEWYRHHW